MIVLVYVHFIINDYNMLKFMNIKLLGNALDKRRAGMGGVKNVNPHPQKKIKNGKKWSLDW